MDRMKDEVISNIRACLISTKGKVSVRQLESDYRLIVGERIPYSKLGFKSVEEFISRIPSLSVTKNGSGECFVDARASEKSNHITDMVNKQKPAKKRAPPKNVRFYNNSKAPQPRKWSPGIAHSKWKDFKKSERTTAVSHNQIISRTPVKSPVVSVKSRLVIPPHSTFRNESAIEPSTSVKPVERQSSTEQFGTLLNTPMRTSYNNYPEPSTPVTSRLRTSNCEDVQRGSPVDLESFANGLLQASRKRITRMMSEVSLERDSGNSSPTNDVVGLQPNQCLPTEILLTDNPIADLKNIVNIYKLGKVDVSHASMVPKKRNSRRLYNCKITVDGNSYLSYPEDFYSEKEAEEYCAKKALDDIIPKCTKKKTLLLSTSKDIKERIPPMLMAHFQGIWSWQIEEDYTDKYLEQLPLNWLEIIDSSDCVSVERIQDRHVLRYCRPGTALQKGENTNYLIPVEISIPSNTVQLGDENRLYAQITCMMSLNEVWCRQWDTVEFNEYSQMTEAMEKFYSSNDSGKRNATIIHLGSYYVAKYDSAWYRVRALEIREKDVNCFLIDFGDEYYIEKENIFEIRREFATAQAQAFVCRLTGLEDLYDANGLSEYLASYVYKEVILEAAHTDADDVEPDQPIAVIMYDYSNGNSINEELLNYLPIAIATPSLKPNQIQGVVVTHVLDDGHVCVQVDSKGLTYLHELLESVQGEVERFPLHQSLDKLDKRAWSEDKDRLYFTRRKDGRWCRTQVTDMSPCNELIQLFYVDMGNDEVVRVSDTVLYPLDKINEVLHQFPAQAVKVKMALEKIPDKFVEKVERVMKVGSPVLLKIIDHTLAGVPRVEFYKRSNDEGLFCINKSITMEQEISAKSEEDSLLKGTMSKLVILAQLKDDCSANVPSGGSLKSPDLPEKGKYFGVIVTFAVNPWNFFVQPYDSSDDLNLMMAKLQKHYENATIVPLQMKMIVPGQIYVTKHHDGIWYRVSVLKVIHSGSISVFYCDFGYYASLNLDQLIPIDPEFTELPYQALKAKLSGIIPKKHKWSMEDCEHFSRLVSGKSLMSVLIDIEKDELYEFDPVLKLALIDTSTDEDVFIDQELIKKNIAIKEIRPLVD